MPGLSHSSRKLRSSQTQFRTTQQLRGRRLLRSEQQPAETDRRSGVVSTSGRSAEDERSVTFRSLGVSEWLDR